MGMYLKNGWVVTLSVIWTWQCVEKRYHVKEKRQSDNCTESEHCSWESGFPQRRRRAVWRGYLFFICRWKLKNVGEGPTGITDERWGSWGYCLAPLPPPLPLPFTFHLLPFWSLPERCHGLSGRRQRGRKGVKPLILCAIFACLTVRLDSSHTPVVCRALRCFAQLQLHQAQLSRGAHWASPRFICLYVRSVGPYPSLAH